MSTTKQDLVRYVEGWRLTGDALRAQRLAELSCLDDETARAMTIDLFGLWRPAEADEFGAELVEQQRVFQRWHRARGRHPFPT